MMHVWQRAGPSPARQGPSRGRHAAAWAWLSTDWRSPLATSLEEQEQPKGDWNVHLRLAKSFFADTLWRPTYHSTV